MLKQALIYLVLSILIVLFARYAHTGIVYIDMFYTWVTIQLTPVFSNSAYGILIRNVLSLTLIPIVIVGIPALIWRAIKGHFMPWFFEAIWIVWLVVVLSKVLIQ
jgi:hypothetical protein